MTTTAIRDGDTYVRERLQDLHHNGIHADLVILACKTDPSQRHTGMSLVVVEAGMEGFERGRNLDKVGMHSQDTAELFFNDVRVPVENRIGDEGEGFMLLVKNLPQERSRSPWRVSHMPGRSHLDHRVLQRAHRVRPEGRQLPEQPSSWRDGDRDHPR